MLAISFLLLSLVSAQNLRDQENAAAGGNSRTVLLSWTASTSTVSGYNIYRATVSGGPYTKINPSLIVGVTYSDSVAAGQIYYYVSTAQDASQNESVFSNIATAVVGKIKPRQANESVIMYLILLRALGL